MVDDQRIYIANIAVFVIWLNAIDNKQGGGSGAIEARRFKLYAYER